WGRPDWRRRGKRSRSWCSGRWRGDVQRRCEVAIIGDSGREEAAPQKQKRGAWPPQMQKRGAGPPQMQKRGAGPREKQKRGARPRFGRTEGRQRRRFGQIGRMLAACRPLGPVLTSNSTRWFSARLLNHLLWISEKWANRSSPPPSGVMKPKPLASLNHFTVPV